MKCDWASRQSADSAITRFKLGPKFLFFWAGPTMPYVCMCVVEKKVETKNSGGGGWCKQHIRHYDSGGNILHNTCHSACLGL